jgi:hypothetical protein
LFKVTVSPNFEKNWFFFAKDQLKDALVFLSKTFFYHFVFFVQTLFAS